MSDLSPEQRGQLARYLDRLLAANERFNLTRVRDRAEAEALHVGDALALLPHLPVGAFELCDVGSGGGVPGVPLAIARPDVRVTLVESVGKKADFLRETAEALGLANAEVARGRAESLANRQFDVVTARAVASLGKLLVWCRPIVRRGGVLLAMKGPRLGEELEAAAGVIRSQRATITVHPYELAGQSGRVVARVRWS